MTTDRNWQHWHDEIADMPEFDEIGRFWLDRETGLRYDKNVNYIPRTEKKAQVKHSEKTLNARNVAKFFGGKALRGSVKQVKWAEEIRSEKIMHMQEQQSIICCDPAGLMTHSKFWIENRDKSSDKIGAFAEKYKSLRADYEKAKSDGNLLRVKEIATEYNALTSQWGFE